MGKIKRYIETSFFGADMMRKIGDRQYDEVDSESSKWLSRYPDDLTGLYLKALVRYYRGDFQECFEYYKRMCKCCKVPWKINAWFADNLLSPVHYKRMQYQQVAGWCSDLAGLIRSPRMKAKTLEFLSFYLRALDRVDELIDIERELSDVRLSRRSRQ